MVAKEKEPSSNDLDLELSKQSNEGKTESLHDEILDELKRIGTGGPWVWKLFFLCFTPNILNGFHVSSYVFLGHMPNDYWCTVPELVTAKWTHEQIKNISSSQFDGTNHGCNILNLDYNNISTFTYDEALTLIGNKSEHQEIGCKSNDNNNYYYYSDAPGSSIVQEWDLVCDSNVWRTIVQVGLSIGKFVGASFFGILSDKYGRRTAFMIASMLYMLGSILDTFSPWYSLFLAGRIMLGSAGSGIFYPAFSLLTENIAEHHRSWMSVIYAMSYPFGLLYLSLAAYLIPQWRYLQLALTIPSFSLFLYSYFIVESPRWLLSKGRLHEAYEIVFKKKYVGDISTKEQDDTIEDKESSKTFFDKLRGVSKELAAIYGPSKLRNRAFVCYFTWCVTSLCYYVTALNADNLAANRYLYVAIIGLVDIPCYVVSVILLRFSGRRISSFALFMFSGACLLLVLSVPGNKSIVVLFAMLGRLGISAVYAIVTLHTAEMFPTEIRNSALGTSSTMAHVGSMAAPFIVDFLGTVAWFVPTTICGILVLLAGCLTLTHPETTKHDLVDHIEDAVKDDS